MSQVGAALDRAVRLADDAPSPEVALASVDRVSLDDDSVLDDWLASLSADEFERFLSGLSEPR